MLAKHEGSLEALVYPSFHQTQLLSRPRHTSDTHIKLTHLDDNSVALTTHLHLLLNRPDLAQRETSSARKWAQDSLLVNIAESWLNLRLGGDKYQAAYYVFEEMASTPSSTGTLALVSQAVSELHLGRVEEAQAALEQALGRDEGDRDALANLVVLLTVAGKRGEAEEVRGRLEKSGKGKGGEHPLLGDLREKERLFDEVATKWGPKVAS